jgi:hypothetical protein
MGRSFSIFMTAIALCGCPSEPSKPPPPPEPKPPPPPAAPVRPPIVPVTKRIDPNAHLEHGPPDFVKRGSGVFDVGGKRWFYGSGSAKGVDNMMRAHLLADQSANAEILTLMKKYNQRAIDLLGANTGEKIETFATAEVAKAQIVDHWIDHDADTWHSLRRVDADLYAESLAKLVGADEATKQKLGRVELSPVTPP